MSLVVFASLMMDVLLSTRLVRAFILRYVSKIENIDRRTVDKGGAGSFVRDYKETVALVTSMAI